MCDLPLSEERWAINKLYGDSFKTYQLYMYIEKRL